MVVFGAMVVFGVMVFFGVMVVFSVMVVFRVMVVFAAIVVFGAMVVLGAMPMRFCFRWGRSRRDQLLALMRETPEGTGRGRGSPAAMEC